MSFFHSHPPGGACARHHVLALAFLAGAASVATAQTAVVDLDPLVVQGRSTDLVGAATSASQGIVGPTELAARPFLRRGELLETIPGVVITQHSGDGKANQYFLRGFNLDHGTDFSVGVDGMPINLRSHAHGQGYADLNFLIPELVQRIDYSKGPFSADVGDFSAAGAAEFHLADELPRAFVSTTIGENDYRRFAMGGSLRHGVTATTAAFEYTHDDGPWTLRERSDRYNALLRHGWKAGENRYRLTLLGYRGTWRSTDQIPERAIADGTLGRFDAVDPTDGGSSERASLSFDGTLPGSSGTTTLNAYALLYRLTLFSNFSYFLDDPVHGDQFNQIDRRAVVGGALTHHASLQVFGTEHELVTGLQLRHDAIGELGLHRTAQRTRLSTVRDDAVDESSAGLFARAESRWAPWLRSTAGIRLDGYHFDVDSDTDANSGTRDAGIVSPKAGLVFGPWNKTELYANLGSGFHSNDARGTTIHVDPADGSTPVDRVAPLVRSRGAEVGVRSSAWPGLVSSVAVWGLDLDSELVFVGDAGGTEPTGRTRRYGVEFANVYQTTSWLALDADLSLTHARYRDETVDRYIANALDTVVTAGLSVKAPRGVVGALRLRYFGPQPLIEDNSVRAPASTLINARIGRQWREWELALDVLNLLDRELSDIAYYYTSRLANETSPVDDVHVHPAEPRTLRISVVRHF